MGNIEITTKFSRLKSISSIDHNYSFTLVIYLFSSVSLQLQRKTIILYCEENLESAKWRSQRAHVTYVPYVPTHPTYPT